MGELTAAAIAGVISADEVVTLAAVRGDAMAQACAIEPTTMAAVLGGDEGDVLDRLAGLGLVPANRNAKGQIVAAGAVEAIDELVANPPEKARVRKLAVAGAFHTNTWHRPARPSPRPPRRSRPPTRPPRCCPTRRPTCNERRRRAEQTGRAGHPSRAVGSVFGYARDSGTAAVGNYRPPEHSVGIARRELKGFLPRDQSARGPRFPLNLDKRSWPQLPRSPWRPVTGHPGTHPRR